MTTISAIDGEFERIVANHLLELSYEVAEEFEEPSHEAGDIEWSWKDLTAERIGIVNDDEDDPAIGIEATCEGTTSTKVTRARRNPPSKAHPAEYETIELLLIASITYYPNRGLGESHCHVHVEDEL